MTKKEFQRYCRFVQYKSETKPDVDGWFKTYEGCPDIPVGGIHPAAPSPAAIRRETWFWFRQKTNQLILDDYFNFVVLRTGYPIIKIHRKWISSMKVYGMRGWKDLNENRERKLDSLMKDW